jgi:hypothetical protein
MHDRQLLGLVILLAVSAGVSMILHWFVVCRALYKHGFKFPTGFVFWRAFRELRAYKNVCSALGQPVDVYYIAFILSWFNILLLSGVLLRILWQATHPEG